MSHPFSHTQDAQRTSAPDSDSDSPNENPKTKPRLNINPSAIIAANTAPGVSPVEDYMAIFRELCQCEIEFTKCTSNIEKLLVSITIAISQQYPDLSTSIPVTQSSCHGIPYNSALSSDQHVSHSATAPIFPLTSQSSQFMYSESVFHEALDLVPKFDGHNMPILQFVHACKRAKKLIPLINETHLVQLLQNKLTGHAYLAIEDKMHDTIDKLTNCLKRASVPLVIQIIIAASLALIT